MAPNICDLCNSIPFEQLPLEEDPSYPHQPSLAALHISTAECSLYKMILTAIDEVKTSIKNEKRGLEGGKMAIFSPERDSAGAHQTALISAVIPSDAKFPMRVK
jgi:hypothetical protein